MRDPRFLRVVTLVAFVLLGATAVAVVAISGGGGEQPSVPEASSRTISERRTSFLTRIVPPGAVRPEHSGTGPPPRDAAALARRMSIERKVAQLFLMGFAGQDATSPIFSQLRRLDLGGVVLAPPNYSNTSQLAALAGEVAVVAREERHVAPWVMAAQEGGEFNAFRDLPPASVAADLSDAHAAAVQATEAGKALRPLGVSGSLAPVIDVGLAEGAALGPRSFSDEPERVAGYAKAVVAAYRRARMFAAVKHFPGLGSASQSTEDGPANVGLSLEELLERDLVPFRAAFEAGAPGVVVGHGLYALDDFVTPASLSRQVTTNLLRRRLRFKGIAITDDLADPPITALGSVPDAAVAALNAGADMLYVSGPSGEQQAAYVAVLRAVRSGEVRRRRLEEAVGRILSVKRDYGLVD